MAINVRPSEALAPCLSCAARLKSVCRAIPDRDLACLVAASNELTVPARRSFIEEGDVATDFYNIVDGSAKLYKSMADGRQQIIGFAGVGSFLGLVAAGPYAFSAEALEPMRLCRFSQPALSALLDEFPAMERLLLERVSAELAAAQEQMLLLGRKTARERLASFLLDPRLRKARSGGTELLHLPMPRSDIADYLGITIETVSRMLSMLRLAGIIDIPGKSTILIRRRKQLESIAARE